MICVEGDFVRTYRTGEGEFGRKRENIGVLAGFVLFLAGISRGRKKWIYRFWICRFSTRGGAFSAVFYGGGF